MKKRYLIDRLRNSDDMSEFESHWAPHSFGLVPHWSKELCKILRNSDDDETDFTCWLTGTFFFSPNNSDLLKLKAEINFWFNKIRVESLNFFCFFCTKSYEYWAFCCNQIFFFEGFLIVEWQKVTLLIPEIYYRSRRWPEGSLFNSYYTKV